jgi:hypothetical protein
MKKACCGIISTVLLLTGIHSHAKGQPKETSPACSLTPASTALAFNVDPKISSNMGVEVTGFVLPADNRAVVNGVDVSKYQDAVDFRTLRHDCQAAFVFIRLSAGTNPDNELTYRDLWKNARSVDLLIGGYHNFVLLDPKKPFSTLPSAEQDKIVAENAQRARNQAFQFLTRLKEMQRSDSDSSGRSPPILPPMLDLSWQPQAKYGSADIFAFAPGYRKAICEWINAVRSTNVFETQHIIMYTRPQMFKDFELGKLECIEEADDYWLSVHTRTGDGPQTDKTIDAALLEDMCKVKGRDRCRFQQYTSFGRFALFGSKATMNLDRFWGTLEDLKALLSAPPSSQ